MMYGYMTLADGTEITHSHVLQGGENREVEVHFERPSEGGFDVARCSLPTYAWLKQEGFSPHEIAEFERFLECNAHLLYRYAESGGLNIA